MSRSFLPSVVAALESAGHAVVQRGVADNGRGDPAEWRISAPLDRAWVESRFDLGSLAWWYVGPAGGWVLVDAFTRATLHGSGEPVAFDPASVSLRAGRTPLAHVAAVPDLRRAWATPTVSDELAVLDGQAVTIRGPHLTSAVRFAESPETALARVREVLDVVLPAMSRATPVAVIADALPAWFVDVCAPRRRTPDEWVAWARETYAEPEWIRRRRWEARWTVEAWLQAMVPAERTWWIAEAAREDELSARLSVLIRRRGGTGASLSWLLHAAGAQECSSVVGPPAAPLVVPALPEGERRDPDDVLAAAAHELLGQPTPLVLETVPGQGSYRWEHRVDGPLDLAALERGLPPDSGLRHGADATHSWLTNGWSQITGDAPVADRPRKKAWWR